MKLWTLATLCTVSLLILSGCVAKPAPHKEPVIDKTLQIVELTKHGVIVDMNAIAFEWKSIKDTKVKGVYVYKRSPDSQAKEATYYATVENRFATHYLDTDIEPDSRYTYYFKTYSDEAESLKSKKVIVNSLPVLASVTWISSITNMPRSAKILWRPHSNQKVKAYVIQRSALEDSFWSDIATVKGRLNAEYIDTKLKDKHTYKYRIKVVTFDGITSTPSQSVKITTKALPKEITNIKVSRNLPKQIKLEWEKATIKDFSHYNIYRSEKVESGYELIAKVTSNSFVNVVEEDGKQYFFRVSTVDQDGLESKHGEQSIQGLTLLKPNAPAIVEAQMRDNTVKLIWSKVDPRTTSYTVVKRYKTSWIDEVSEEFVNITDKQFIDDKILPDTTYFYTVYAVDSNSLKSEPSTEVELKSKKQLPVVKVHKTTILPVNNNDVAVEPVVEEVEIIEEEVITPTQDF